MAQAGFTPLQLYHTSTALAVPAAGDMVQGELAINITDGKLYFKDASNNVTLLAVAGGAGAGTVTSVAASGGTTGLTFSGSPIITTGTLTLGGTLGTNNGGTGQTTYTNGQLLIGNTSTGGLTKATLTAGSGVTITNGAGTITIAATGGGGGSVSSVTATFPATSSGGATPDIGIAHSGGACTTTTGTGALVFASGPSITLANATGLPLSTGVTGTLPVANGGTGVTTSTGSGAVVLSTSPTLTTPNLGTPSAINLSNASGLTSGQVTTALGYTPYNATNPSGFVTSSGSVAFATNAGNASTVTNGVYTNANNTFSGSNTFSSSILASGAVNLGSSGNPWTTVWATGGIRNVSGNVGLNLTDGSGALNYGAFTSIYSNGTTAMGFSVSSTATNEVLQLQATGIITRGGHTLRPDTNGVANLGDPSFRWNTVYAAVGTINTSDRNQKTEIANLDEAEKRVAIRIKGLIKKFKFKDAVAKKGDKARIHVGVIAQEIGDAFVAEGLDPHKYALFCYDEWEAEEAKYYNDGKLIQEAKKAGSSYGIRYDELLAFVIASL